MRTRRRASLSVLQHGLLIIVALVMAIGAPGFSLASAQTPVEACAPLAGGIPAPETATAPEIPPVQVPENAIPVTMGYVPISIYAPVFVAFEKGYFAERRLDVTLESLAGGSDMVLLTATGDFDLGIGGIGPAYWNAASQDLGVRIIAPGHAEGSPVATPLMISRTTCESGAIASVADLRGKRVAVNAPGATELWLDTALQTGGLTIGDVDLQFLSFPDAVVALESGAIDAAMVGEPLATKAEGDGFAVRLLADFPVQNIQPTMIFGNGQWLNDNPEAAAGFIAAYLRAARDLTENFNDPVNLAIIEKYTQVPPALIAGSVKPVYSTDGAIDVAGIALLQTFFRNRGQLDYDDNLDPASLVDTQYVDRANQLLND
ncbi:MAG: ABC transporter substrate-binding protein [Chloroflexia bacterium]|nr:ABC transporter substrate-binding protein [Chloroflexia bacterium]